MALHHMPKPQRGSRCRRLAGLPKIRQPDAVRTATGAKSAVRTPSDRRLEQNPL